MSDDFGKSVRRPPMHMPTEKELAAMHPDHDGLGNAKYNRLLKDYLGCVTMYMQDFWGHDQLEQQLNRRDLDTVCAYELYQMKKEFTSSNVLNMSQFVPKNQWESQMTDRFDTDDPNQSLPLHLKSTWLS